MKVVIGGIFPPGAIDLFLENLPKDADVEIVTDEAKLNEVTDTEVLLTRGVKIGAEFMDRNPKLKFIQKWGSGLDVIDVKAAGERGIPVSNVPGANAYAVSELTVMLMLAVYRNLLYHNAKIRAGIWSKAERVEQTYCLNGKTIGIIGSGHIGRLVAKKVQAFEAKTVYYDVFRMDEKTEQELNMKYLPLDELLRVSDIVTLHIPLLDSTKNFISKPQLDMMKDNAVLINAARGGLVNEPDLLAALDSGKLLGAGLDCLVNEKDKLRADDPMLHNDKITVTPHVGGTSNDLAQVMAPRMAKNVARFLRGEPILSVANKEYLKQK
ncbi:MAG: 2-hydroxyacid dehydrogenase [Pyramidobacter sp.]|nr:2-hydroxyacid dehydrogenase [Pyramidobacter sp.]